MEDQASRDQVDLRGSLAALLVRLGHSCRERLRGGPVRGERSKPGHKTTAGSVKMATEIRLEMVSRLASRERRELDGLRGYYPIAKS